MVKYVGTEKYVHYTEVFVDGGVHYQRSHCSDSLCIADIQMCSKIAVSMHYINHQAFKYVWIYYLYI